ncbi:1-deoxy-D-xylulose-5-phosphate reductoisomerase [Aurantivibrio infirmus]
MPQFDPTLRHPIPGKVTRSITILGSTGSIGVSTLDVVALHPEKFSVFALSANTQCELMLQQCMAFRPQYAVMRCADAASKLSSLLKQQGSETAVLSGEEGLVQVASAQEVDTVMAAIVGAAGLTPALAAVSAGKKILLANKESLVMAGALFMEAVIEHDATLLPIDSEHNAIFQCLPTNYSSFQASGLTRIILTGSGGPFRTLPLSEFANIRPEDACKHPNWSMGQKISVDSATMMNKGLEFIEASWLFGASKQDIEVVIHPQSIVHSMVEYADGSILAQLGNPDMRTPIAQALAWPERIESGVGPLDLVGMGPLEFYAPDLDRFPCLNLAIETAGRTDTSQVVLNAANEVAVAAFLAGQIDYSAISVVIEKTLGKAQLVEPTSIEVVKAADFDARILAQELIECAS